MKTTIIFITACALSLGAIAKVGSHSVRGHVTKSGTYVQPHRATNRDSTRVNNWSQKGNVNPYNGKAGTKK
jgi:hypothetical protein